MSALVLWARRRRRTGDSGACVFLSRIERAAWPHRLHCVRLNSPAGDMVPLAASLRCAHLGTASLDAPPSNKGVADSGIRLLVVAIAPQPFHCRQK